MRDERQRWAAWLLAAAVLAPTGCARRQPPPAAATPGNLPTGAPAAPTVLRYPFVIQLSTVDPARILDSGAFELLQNIYEGLVALDADNRVVPRLAERWEVSPDGKTYTFHLRRDARFHTPFDRPITAADVKYSFERALHPETQSPTAANYLSGIVGAADVSAGRRQDLEGVTVKDAHTVGIRLDRPRSYFLSTLTFPTAWIVCKEVITGNGGRLNEKAAIGTGPFRLAEHRPGVRVLLIANHDYYGGEPRLTRVERPIVLDPQTRHLMYENNEVDVCVISLPDYARDQHDAKLKNEVRLVPTAAVVFLTLHGRLQPAFADRRVRRALAQALDRDEIIRVVGHGAWQRADSLLPPGLPGANPHAHALPHDAPGARRLLSEAGYAGGKGFPHLTLVYMEKSPEATETAQILRRQLRENLGVTVDLQEREVTSFIADAFDRETIPFTIGGWVADYLDPQDFLSVLFRSGAKMNHYAYHNAHFDALCDQADVEPDTPKRLALYQEADRIAVEDVAVLPLCFSKSPVLVKPYVRDFGANLINFLPLTRTRIER